MSRNGTGSEFCVRVLLCLCVGLRKTLGEAGGRRVGPFMLRVSQFLYNLVVRAFKDGYRSKLKAQGRRRRLERRNFKWMQMRYLRCPSRITGKLQVEERV